MLTKKLLFSLILAFFLMSICMSVGAIAKEQANLQESKFVEVATEIEYEDYNFFNSYGMVKNGSVVTIEVVLTNFSKPIDKSDLSFYSYFLEKENIEPTISVDGKSKEYKSPFTVNHGRDKEVKILVRGKAPEVKKRENITFLNITQEVKGVYCSVESIKKDVSSEIIEDAIIAMNEAREKLQSANWTIANATEKGIDVSEADTAFEMASVYLENAERDYWEGWPKESIETATNASYYAELAKQKAESAVGTKKHMNYSALAVVAIIAIVVIVFLNRARQRKRGVY
ncbi:hypothetical protein C5S32_10735 [ANME-1 cluster archaeon GoMg1]|nr:hypothetical protein [ANME-1 cluster archaeon GoMg1]